MRVLLDECIPRRLKREPMGHECQTVREAGFAGKKNGELLELAEAAGFDLLLTVDKGFEHQQNLSQRKKLSLLVLGARSNDIQDILPHLLLSSRLSAA